MKHVAIFSCTLAVLSSVSCIAFRGPIPTPTGLDHDLHGWTPKPTNGPSIGELRIRETNANASICGFAEFAEDGDDYEVDCDSDFTCIFFTGTNSGTSVGMAGCCSSGDTQNCGWLYSCVNYQSSCDTSCIANSFITSCGEQAPYCVTSFYSGSASSVFDYGCTDDTETTVVTLYQTAEDGYSISVPVISGKAISFADSTTARNKTGTSNVQPQKTSSPTEQTPSPSPSPLPSKKKSSTGAIVGGVVGGIAALSILGAALLYFCVQQKKRKQLTGGQTTSPESSFQLQNQPLMSQHGSAPIPGQEGYYGQSANDAVKYGHLSQVGGYPGGISNTGTPAPPYSQPHYSNAPVVPAPVHEADSVSVLPPEQRVHELGDGEARNDS